MKKILIPVDFSEISGYARDVAVKVALKFGAELHLLNVIVLPSHILKTYDGDLLDDGEMDVSSFKSQRESALKRLNSWVNNPNIHVKSVVRFGHINEETVKYSEAESIDLIVMATHGATGMKELISGSHAEYVAMHTPVPVLTLKCERSEIAFKTMMLAGSFSEDDIPHCERLLELQKTFDAKLHLVRINTASRFLADDKAISHMKAFAEKHGISNVEYAVYNADNVEDGIIQYAAGKDIELIAIGSMQRTGLSKILNGCVSADLVNHLYKPLLTFKLKD